MRILTNFGTQNGDLLTRLLTFFANILWSVSQHIVYDYKNCLHDKFQFSMYFVSVLAKNGHFDHFWDTKWGFTDPTNNIILVIIYGAYLSISCMTIKTYLG